MNLTQRIPSEFFIEISSRCQAKCPYCAQFRLKQAKQYGDFISTEVFKKIIERLVDLEFINVKDGIINLYNWGEPLLNNHLNDILRLLQKKGMYANLSSNFMIKPEIEPDLLPESG